MLRGIVAPELHLPDALKSVESIESYLTRNAETELRNLRRRLGLDPDWNARRDAARASNPRARRRRTSWLPRRPRGRPTRWLRDLYALTAIDRLRAEQGLSVKRAAEYVATVLLAGPWSPDHIADAAVFNRLFPSTFPADLPRSLAENLRNAYVQRARR